LAYQTSPISVQIALISSIPSCPVQKQARRIATLEGTVKAQAAHIETLSAQQQQIEALSARLVQLEAAVNAHAPVVEASYKTEKGF